MQWIAFQIASHKNSMLIDEYTTADNKRLPIWQKDYCDNGYKGLRVCADWTLFGQNIEHLCNAKFVMRGKWLSYYLLVIPRREVICLLARLLEGPSQDMQFIYTEGSVSEAKAYCWNRAIVHHLDLG